MAATRQQDEFAGRRRGPAAAAIALLAAGLLAACNPLPYAKLVTDDMDKGFSLVTEEECDLQNLFAGESYCKTRLVLRDDPPLYCYRTLGVPDCYAIRDPHGVARRDGGRQAPPMALGDATPAAVSVGPDLAVQYGGGLAVPDGAQEVVEVASEVPRTSAVPPALSPPPPAIPQVPVETRPLPDLPGGPQALPPKSTLSTQ